MASRLGQIPRNNSNKRPKTDDPLVLGALTSLRDWLGLTTTPQRLVMGHEELQRFRAAVVDAIHDGVVHVPRPVTRRGLLEEIKRLQYDRRYSSAYESAEMSERLEECFSQLAELENQSGLTTVVRRGS